MKRRHRPLGGEGRTVQGGGRGGGGTKMDRREEDEKEVWEKKR